MTEETTDDRILQRIQVAYEIQRGTSFNDVRRMFGVNSAFISRWREGRTLHDFYDAPRSGRPRFTTEREDAQLAALAESHRSSTLAELIQLFEERTRKHLSRATADRRLHEFELFAGHSTPVPPLSEEVRKLRVLYCRSMLKEDHSTIVFQDEAGFYQESQSRLVWKHPGEIVQEEMHGTVAKLSAAGVISSSGTISLVTYSGGLTSDFYRQLWEEDFLPSALNVVGDGFRIVQDNLKQHKSRTVQNLFSDSGVEDLRLPPYSPDLNPIENVWHTLKYRMAGRKYGNIDELAEDLVREWESLTPAEVAKYVSDLPRRYRAVIRSGGDTVAA